MWNPLPQIGVLASSLPKSFHPAERKRKGFVMPPLDGPRTGGWQKAAAF
jgi:hypothetical protein